MEKNPGGRGWSVRLVLPENDEDSGVPIVVASTAVGPRKIYDIALVYVKWNGESICSEPPRLTPHENSCGIEELN
ncbi:hypothetical protein RUM44_001121 [Polyplax serrata]|uniref:Uncharacterized protein n=1 Tax=Polyplax serrata TaxID=468196 RepID=A0ABR1B7S6_POLSC